MKPFARIILVLTLVFAAAAEAKLAPPKLEDYTHGDIVTVSARFPKSGATRRSSSRASFFRRD